MKITKSIIIKVLQGERSGLGEEIYKMVPTIEEAYNKAERATGTNYAYIFGKTRNYWSAANWGRVASDVKKILNK